MFQICWSNSCLGNLSCFQVSAITQPDSMQVLQSAGLQRVECASAKGNSGCTLSLPFPFFGHAQSQSSAGPKQDQALSTVFALSYGAELSSAKCFEWCLPVLYTAAQRWCSPAPVCVGRTRGGCWGTARVWGLFSQSYYKFLQCELLMFSKTQAERTC